MNNMARNLSSSASSKAHQLPRICYVHIPKSAGTYLRHVLQTGFNREDLCDFRFQGDFMRANPSEYMTKRLFSAHVGYDFAKTLQADLITVLRNPFDRVLSLYYYWKEIEGGPDRVKSMDLDEFLESRIPMVHENIHNVQAWQIAFGHLTSIRKQHQHVSDDDLLSHALDNLQHFKIVGVYEKLDSVTRQIEDRYGIAHSARLDRVNATKIRPSLRETSVVIRDKIYARNSVDVALYDHVVRSVLREQ